MIDIQSYDSSIKKVLKRLWYKKDENKNENKTKDIHGIKNHCIAGNLTFLIDC